jgi:cytidyltransferase-like protein
MPKKAFVSGCFDLLHSGHVAFFQEAAQYGDLYVAIGSDRNIFQLKNRPTINNQAERLYMIKALACVHTVFVAKGSGILDFVDELKEIRPDYFIVNEDGSTSEKAQLCAKLGIEYVILKRTPHPGLDVRSTTTLRGFSTIPCSIDLAGGWLDQPLVSKQYPGPVLTISVHPFNQDDDILNSARVAAIELWGARLPADNPKKLAKMLYGYSNLPGTKEISGTRGAIGIAFPGLTRADYAGKYWPAKITSMQDEHTLKFIDDLLYLIPLNPPAAEMPTLELALVTLAGAKSLASAAEACWEAILAKDVTAFGRSLRESFDAQMALCPHLLAKSTLETIESYRERTLGWKVLGETLVLVSDKPIENATRISIRRASD